MHVWIDWSFFKQESIKNVWVKAHMVIIALPRGPWQYPWDAGPKKGKFRTFPKMLPFRSITHAHVISENFKESYWWTDAHRGCAVVVLAPGLNKKRGSRAQGPIPLKRHFGSDGSNGTGGCTAVCGGFACIQHELYVCESNRILPRTSADEFHHFWIYGAHGFYLIYMQPAWFIYRWTSQIFCPEPGGARFHFL